MEGMHVHKESIDTSNGWIFLMTKAMLMLNFVDKAQEFIVCL